MSADMPSDPRSRNGAMPPLHPPSGDGAGHSGAMPVSQIIRAIRRHMVLVVFVAGATAGAVLSTLQEPAHYRAVATLRLAGERVQAAASMEDISFFTDRSIAPVLSLVPRIRSRRVLGEVVDSLGLQARWVPQDRGWLSLLSPVVPVIDLQGVEVAPDVPTDTLQLVFTTGSIQIRRDAVRKEVEYGTPIAFDGVQFAIHGPPSLASADLTIRSRDIAIDRTLDRLMVVPVAGTDAIEIQYVDFDPVLAQRVANAIARSFRATTIESSRDQASRRREFLEDQLKEAERLLGRAHGNLSGFRRRQQMASSSDRIAVRQAAVLALEARRGELEADRRVYESVLEQLEGADAAGQEEGLRTLVYSPEVVTHPVVGRLYQELLAYRTQLDSLTTGPWRASESNPDVVHLTARLGRAQEELTRAVRAQLRSLDQRAKALADIRDLNADSIQALPAIEAEEGRLSQQIASLSTLADELRLEFQKARIAEQLQAGDIEIVDFAAMPREPIGVPGWLKMFVALVAGGLLGSALALVLELRNRSIRGPEELAKVIPVRGLGIIPHVEEATATPSFGSLRRRLNGKAYPAGEPEGVVVDSPRPSVGTESFRLLYSSLTFGWGERQRVILVTSVAPKEGKTLVASNLAVTFAREGARVLLVDCDLRRPRLHHIFHIPRAPGLTELLRTKFADPNPSPAAPPEPADVDPPVTTRSYSMMPGSERPETTGSPAPAADKTAGTNAVQTQPAAKPAPLPWDRPRIIRSTSIRRLSVLPCGELPSNPAEVLRTGSIRRMLEEFSEDFDVVILDTPPVLVSADAVLLAPSADGVLLIIRAGQTDRASAERAYEQLEACGARVLGTVLNDPAGEVARFRTLYYSYDYPPVPD